MSASLHSCRPRSHYGRLIVIIAAVLFIERGPRCQHNAAAVVMDISRAQCVCDQCGVLTYPHYQCRCRICGNIHKHHPGCRPVACDQCGITAVPHRSCRCRLCGKMHSKLSGCSVIRASSLKHLPSDRQAVMLASRSDCPQCRKYTVPHSRCRCHSCGLMHNKLRGCRVPHSDLLTRNGTLL